MWSVRQFLTAVNLDFLDPSHYILFQVAPHLSSRGWVGSVSDPLLLSKSGSAGNRTPDLWICNQELWLLDHRGGRRKRSPVHNRSQCVGSTWRPRQTAVSEILWSNKRQWWIMYLFSNDRILRIQAHVLWQQTVIHTRKRYERRTIFVDTRPVNPRSIFLWAELIITLYSAVPPNL
jgi:hypothetical protein